MSVYDTYNGLSVKERKNHEFEIRYNSNNLTQNTVISLITDALKDLNVTEEQFIDSLEYTESGKVGTRTFINKDKTNKCIQFKKEMIHTEKSQNIIGQYSLNVCKEIEINKSDVPLNASTVLLKKRYSYTLPTYKSWRIDVSIIRKTEPSSVCIKSAYKEFFIEVSSFSELIPKLEERPYIYSYQIEIEYIGTKNIKDSEVEKVSIAPFLRINSNIEKKIMYEQESIYLSNIINQTTDILPKRKSSSRIYLKYILPQVRTITKQQYLDIYPPTSYMLKEKVDGKRAIISIHNKMGHIIREPEYIESHKINNFDKTIIVDTEYIDNKKEIVVFDVLVYNNEDIQNQGIETRMTYINKSCTTLNKLLPEYKFHPATYFSMSNPQRYKGYVEDKLNNSKFPTDGLILVKTKQTYKDTITFKWKPTHLQTIDLLCKKCPEHLLKAGNYPTKDKHELYILYATASRTFIQNLRLSTNYGYNQMFKLQKDYINVPIPFSTPFAPLSYLYYHPLDDDRDIDGKIVEVTCLDDCINHEGNKYFVNWKINGIRNDKVVIDGLHYGNNYSTALYTFLNHINTFDTFNLYNGIPNEQYYQNSGGEENVYSAVRLLANYIKSQLINEYAHRTQAVLDIGSGRGGDLYKYVQQNLVKNLLVVDKDKTSLSELFSRWLELARSSRTILYTSIRGLVMDVNEDAETNVHKIRNIIDTSNFDTIFAHSSMHYFTESTESLRNFVYMCEKLTAPGSKVVITCPNGEAIFDILKDRKEWIATEQDMTKFRIIKLYTDDTMTEAGQKISVMLPFSKGKMYDEYLVNSKVLISTFKEHNFTLHLHKSFKDYLEGFNIYKKDKYDQLTPIDIQWSSLFMTLVFKKNALS